MTTIAHVGLTAYSPCDDPKRAHSLPADYIDCTKAAGLHPVLLVGGAPRESLRRLDGLVLSGGGDIDPACYGGSVHENNYMVDPTRDAYELELARIALDVGMPVLAICRGMQILNVACGGTLVAHLPERYGDAVMHRAPPREPIAHQVQIERGSRLAAVVGEQDLEVMSWHHQAVDRLGDGLRPAARARDGVVEAMEFEDDSQVLAVQWHPELNAARSPRQQCLFSALAGYIAGTASGNVHGGKAPRID